MPHEIDNKAGAAQHGELKPEYLRPNGMLFHFGIGRTQTYDLIASGKIKSVSLKKRGQRHGTRLISFDSVVCYLESLSNSKP